jgi:thermostable 8-oxoguanine DNA glycosylase
MIPDLKEYMKEYGKEYYNKNKKSIVDKRQEKMECSKCGKVVSMQSRWAHKRSKKCLKIQGAGLDETKEMQKF